MSEEGNDNVEATKTVTFQVTTRKKTSSHEHEFIKISIPRFSGESAQDYLRWVQQFKHVSRMKSWSTEEQTLHLNLVLDDEALEAWVNVSEDVDMADKDEFLTTYQKWALMFVPNTYHEQLEEELFLFAKRRNESVSECHQRMRRITRMVKNVPTNALELDDQILIRTFKRAMPHHWKKAVQYFERLEQSERRQEKERRGKGKKSGDNNNSDKNNSNKKNKGKTNKKAWNKSQKDKQDGNKWCKLHKTSSHSDSECFTQKKNAGESKAKAMTSGKKAEEANITLTEEEDSEYSFSDDSECKVISTLLKEKPPTKPPMRLRFRLSKTSVERVALVDTGCEKSYINGDVRLANQKLGFSMSQSNVTYEQVEGYVNASGSMPVAFRFLDLNYGTRIMHTFSVISDAKDEVVIGRDLLGALGIIVNFRDRIMEWNGNTVTGNTGTGVEPPANLLDSSILDEVKD